MFDSPLSRVAQKLGFFTSRCEFSSFCRHFQRDSDTCMNAPDKTYCGIYNRFQGVNNSE